jgi:hypothetical protein
MKILIHNLVTDLYLADGGQRVKSISEAQDFKQSSAAIQYVSLNALANVELTYAFPDQQYNILIPLAEPSLQSNRDRR